MTTTGQTITVYEGEDKTIAISVTDTTGGTAVNYAGATAITWRVTTDAESETAIIEKTLADAEISLADDEGTNDQIVIVLDAADTTSIGPETYYHECRVVDSSGDSQVVAVGDFVLKASSSG